MCVRDTCEPQKLHNDPDWLFWGEPQAEDDHEAVLFSDFIHAAEQSIIFRQLLDFVSEQVLDEKYV